MAKDPAFLFYYQDFMVGTSDMTNEEVGAYIKCLCIQAAKGGITEKHMKIICESYENHNQIKSKFILNSETGLFENLRLSEEIIKRRKYSESRANNKKGKTKDQNHMKNISKSYEKHMEDENENEDVIKKETTKKNSLDFSFVSENFKEVFFKWLDYKKERGENYKGQISIESCYNKLVKYSNNNPATANTIIEDSIGSNYAGFFRPKPENSSLNQPKRGLRNSLDRSSSINLMDR